MVTCYHMIFVIHIKLPTLSTQIPGVYRDVESAINVKVWKRAPDYVDVLFSTSSMLSLALSATLLVSSLTPEARPTPANRSFHNPQRSIDRPVSPFHNGPPTPPETRSSLSSFSPQSKTQSAAIATSQSSAGPGVKEESVWNRVAWAWE